jgi:hypothetical protein
MLLLECYWRLLVSSWVCHKVMLSPPKMSPRFYHQIHVERGGCDMRESLRLMAAAALILFGLGTTTRRAVAQSCPSPCNGFGCPGLSCSDSFLGCTIESACGSWCAPAFGCADCPDRVVRRYITSSNPNPPCGSWACDITYCNGCRSRPCR